jgi:cytochrome o ubiquinol oxidase subunit III
MDNNLISKAEKSKTYLGFWIYIMTDCVVFASLFAVYATLHKNTNGGDSAQMLFSMPLALTQTLILLTSSLTSGLAIISALKKDKNKILFWTFITFLLGALFLFFEFREFHHLVTIGDSWRASGFLSSYFVLVGTHGLHILIGLFWIIILSLLIISKGITAKSMKGLVMFNLFWHFLDVIWIFIFSVVYLMGHMGL